MYAPTDYRSFHRVMRYIGIRERDVFLDYGSGLGRVLLMAAQYPFRRVLGVELSARLNEPARQNVACWRGKLRCRNIELIQADATVFVPPYQTADPRFFRGFQSGSGGSMPARWLSTSRSYAQAIRAI
jgi:tRNA G46 methylase TrmB